MDDVLGRRSQWEFSSQALMQGDHLYKPKRLTLQLKHPQNKKAFLHKVQTHVLFLHPHYANIVASIWSSPKAWLVASQTHFHAKHAN